MTVNRQILLLVIGHSLAAVPVLSLPAAVPAPFPGGVGPDGTRYKTAYRCEGQRLELTCPEEHKIKIIRANFGRFSIAICNMHGKMDMSVNCMAPSSTRVMKKRCDSKDSCSIQINSSIFGDPCPNTPKYLEVHYGCVPTATTTTKKPLPPWFVEGGGDALWDSRIPDPPEGFSPEGDTRQIETEEADSNQPRIPITTPTTVVSSSTTTVTTTATTKVSSTTLPRLSEPKGDGKAEYSVGEMDSETTTHTEGMEYYPNIPTQTGGGSGGGLDVNIVDIPVSDLPLHCPPVVSRNLNWNWTAAGETAIQRCPPGSTGLARWSCSLPQDQTGQVSWATSQPDMGDCKTLSMSRLEAKVQTGDMENVISSSLAHLTRSDSLYGGDVEQSAAVMRTLANRIQYLLQTQGDTFYNKGIYIQEVLLNMVRAASNLFDISNRSAWRDLSPARQVKAANSIVQALEENAFLFAEVTNKEETMMESAKNIYMSVTIQDVGRMSNGTELSRGAEEEEEESSVNSVFIPFNVLWDQARSGVIKIVHFTYLNAHELLEQANIVVSAAATAASAPAEEKLKLNSGLVSASFGRTRRIQFPDAVEVTIHHLTPVEGPQPPVCVSWNPELGLWSDTGCSLLQTDGRVSRCRCDHMAVYGVVSRVSDTSATPGFSIVTLQIVTYVVAAISVLCVVLILIKFRRGLVRFVCKVSKSSEKHVCNPKSSTTNQDTTNLHTQLQRTLSGGGESKGPEFLVQGQDGTMTILPSLYKTSLETGQPVMVTLNPYSSQLVENLNKMMREGELESLGGTMNPQLARLTATLRKKRCELGHPGPCRHTCGISLQEMVDQTARINPADVVFRAVSPHGHVYWEINPKEDPTRGLGKVHKSQNSSGDENTNSDLQNVSDFSDDDHRAHSEMSRQSSSRFSESRPLIYTSSASTSPGGSEFSRHVHLNEVAAAAAGTLAGRHSQLMDGSFSSPTRNKLARGLVAGRAAQWPTLPPSYHEEVYAYAATDFSTAAVPEQLQSQVQIKDIRAVPVSVKSKEYIMAKIADYSERNGNRV